MVPRYLAPVRVNPKYLRINYTSLKVYLVLGGFVPVFDLPTYTERVILLRIYCVLVDSF